MKQTILLATTVNWPSAARLAGAFTLLGASVEAVAPRNHVLHASRYPKHIHRYRPLQPLDSIAKAIHTAEPDLVIPCDDRALALLLAVPGCEPLLRRSLGPLEHYPVLTARSPSLAAAREDGIEAPLTLAVPDHTDLAGALGAVGLPCVMKTDASWGGNGVKLVRTREEAEKAYAKLKGPPERWRSVARALLRKDMHYIAEAWTPRTALVNVQAFVPGKPATSVFAARDGQVLAALHMDVIACEGGTGPASRMRRIDSPAMDEAAHKIAARFSLNGLHGLDFMRDEAGVAHLIEINPRATQICHLALGPDLPAALLGVPARRPVTSKAQIALFPQLVKGARGDLSIYEDIPWDDPVMLHAAAAGCLPEAEELELIPEFSPSAHGPRIFRRPVYGPPAH
jgi:hypothetical protein